jgi:hypothetical protein
MRAYPSEIPCRRNSVDADAHKQSTANVQAAQAGGKHEGEGGQGLG